MRPLSDTKTAGADGALPGKYKVTISVVKDSKELVPPRYSDKEKTSLTVEVAKGKASEIDLKLASK